MKVVFFGTSQFALSLLEVLKQSKHELTAIFTQPDKRGGRKLKFIKSPVKKWSLKNGYTCYQPQNILDEVSLLKRVNADLFVVAGYGHLLPNKVINIPRLFCINIHPSILPKYRGAAPVNWAIINGERQTGVTIFRLSSKMDAGDIILQKRIKIEDSETNLTLEKKLSRVAADLLIETLERIENNQVNFVPQDDTLATYAPKLKKEDGLIDWTRSAVQILNLIRGTKKWPSAYSYLNHRILKIHEAEIIEDNNLKKNAHPAEIIAVKKGNGLVVKTGKGYLNILNLQLEGKRKMSTPQFILGHRIEEGQKLGR